MTHPQPDYSTATVLLEIKRPVPVAELVALTDALTRLYGDGLLMRQEGPYLQIVKPAPTDRQRLYNAAAVVSTDLVRRLGPYFIHGPTLRRLGLGEDTTTKEHKQRGIMMRGCFRANHAHAHGKRWSHDKGCNTPVYQRNHPPKRKGAICFCIPPNTQSSHPEQPTQCQ